MMMSKLRYLFSLYGASLHYQLFSRKLHVLLISDGLGTLLRAKLGKDRLRTALVGHDPRILSLTEAIWDSGFDISFFQGGSNDQMHPSRPLQDLDVGAFDVILVSDEDPAKEAEFLGKLAGAKLPVVPLGRLLNAHLKALNEIPRGSGGTCLNPRKQALVAAALAISDPAGIVLECGVYMGGTTVYMAHLQRHLGMARPIYALDTYEGMPEPTQKDFGSGFVYTAGMFSDNHEQTVRKVYKSAGVQDQIEVVPGLCQETLPTVVSNSRHIAFALLDTDQYAGTKGGLDSIGDKLRADGIVIVDDTSVHGVDTAIKEALMSDPSLMRRPLAMNFDAIFTSRP
ncbi:MAG: TylF/MycF/NovP-related O-methyltransferase [Alphaproteobacteria bacterium]